MVGMDTVTLDELRLQMRVETSEEDELITVYGEAAEKAVIGATCRSLDELKEMGGGVFPTPLKVAVMMTAATFYRDREAVTNVAANPVPYSVDFLVKPYVKLVDDAE